MLITKEQMWTRFRNILKHKPSDYKIRCHVCGEEIQEGDPGVEYVKTKRGSELFIHTACVMDWGGSVKVGDR